MRAKTTAALAAALWLAAPAPPAWADSADARCEYHKEGETKAAPTGHCTFSQRQGHVSLDLRNGETFELSPAGKADHFEDQDDHKVVRTVRGDGTHEYKWKHKKVIVTFKEHGRDHHEKPASSSGDTPHDLRDLVHGPLVGGEVDDELARRGYRHKGNSVSGDDVWSNWRSRSGQCVTVHFREGRVRSIVDVPDFDCE